MAVAQDPDDALVAGLMSFLAALTAQLVVLPLIIRTAGRPAAAGPGELMVQRILMAAVTFAVFWPETGLAITFMVFPVLGWAAIRATRRETPRPAVPRLPDGVRPDLQGRGPLAGRCAGSRRTLSRRWSTSSWPRPAT